MLLILINNFCHVVPNWHGINQLAPNHIVGKYSEDKATEQNFCFCTSCLKLKSFEIVNRYTITQSLVDHAYF